MPGFRRRRLRIVVPHVEVLHRGIDQLLRIDAVQAVHAHRHLLAGARERAHAALVAEAVMDHFSAELVVDERLLAGKQAEVARRDTRQPGARLEADRAVAFEGALREVEIGLEAHRAAVAAAVIGLLHESGFTFWDPRSPSTTCRSGPRP